MKIKSRIWVEDSEKGVVLGEGRARLLEAIEENGSLSKAAKSLNMSYKKAWELTDSMNSAAKEPLTVKITGGNGGGSTSLTPYGKQLLSNFKLLNEKCWAFLDEEAEKMGLS